MLRELARACSLAALQQLESSRRANDLFAPAAPAVARGDDPNVLKREIEDIRKSVVSMSVGQPERTSTIVKEWLEQPAPSPSEPDKEDSSGEEGEEEGEEG